MKFSLANSIFLVYYLTTSVVALPPPSHSAFLLVEPQNSNLTVSTHASNLNAPPPAGYYIDGSSFILPHPYRVTFEHYGAPIPDAPSAHAALESAAIEMHQYDEDALMGTKQRVYASGNVVVGIKPGNEMTWGYWGATVRAIDAMWQTWDVIDLEFVVGVQVLGVIGGGFVTSTVSPE